MFDDIHEKIDPRGYSDALMEQEKKWDDCIWSDFECWGDILAW